MEPADTPLSTEKDTMSASPAAAATARTDIRIETKVATGRPPVAALQDIDVAMSVKNLRLFYGEKQALHDVTMNIPRGHVVAFIGPSGCGKSTLLRCFNRMNDLVDGCRIEGQILIDGKDIYDRKVNVAQLRRRVGMVFQKPNPFPKSIYENVAYGPKIHGLASRRSELDEIGGVDTSVDYQEEQKFVRHAAAKARTGAEIINLTYRDRYTENPDGQWQGYRDTNRERAWGVADWGHRAGQGDALRLRIPIRGGRLEIVLMFGQFFEIGEDGERDAIIIATAARKRNECNNNDEQGEFTHSH